MAGARLCYTARYRRALTLAAACLACPPRGLAPRPARAQDPDETLKRKTLDLLFRMTSAANVAFVVDRLLHQLRQTSDVHFRAELAERITQLAERCAQPRAAAVSCRGRPCGCGCLPAARRLIPLALFPFCPSAFSSGLAAAVRYAPDNGWFITTMNAVFELGGDVVQAETAHNLLRLIAEGSGEDDEADTELRLHAVSAYYGLLQQPHLPDVLMKARAAARRAAPRRAAACAPQPRPQVCVHTPRPLRAFAPAPLAPQPVPARAPARRFAPCPPSAAALRARPLGGRWWRGHWASMVTSQTSSHSRRCSKLCVT